MFFLMLPDKLITLSEGLGDRCPSSLCRAWFEQAEREGVGKLQRYIQQQQILIFKFKDNCNKLDDTFQWEGQNSHDSAAGLLLSFFGLDTSFLYSQGVGNGDTRGRDHSIGGTIDRDCRFLLLVVLVLLLLKLRLAQGAGCRIIHCLAHRFIYIGACTRLLLYYLRVRSAVVDHGFATNPWLIQAVIIACVRVVINHRLPTIDPSAAQACRRITGVDGAGQEIAKNVIEYNLLSQLYCSFFASFNAAPSLVLAAHVGSNCNQSYVTQADNVLRKNDHCACFMTFVVACCDANVFKYWVHQGVSPFSTCQPVVNQEFLQNLVGCPAPKLIHFRQSTFDDRVIFDPLRQSFMQIRSLCCKDSSLAQN